MHASDALVRGLEKIVTKNLRMNEGILTSRNSVTYRLKVHSGLLTNESKHVPKNQILKK